VDRTVRKPVGRSATVLLVAAGFVYALFAIACFRLAVVNDSEAGVSVGEGMFTILGAAALFAAIARPGRRAAIVVLGTVPLVGWFVATPWNSGPPFLAASILVPAVAAVSLLRRHRLVRRGA
jgi:hypothetical protein